MSVRLNRENWEPRSFHKDPMVNAVLNLAREVRGVGEAVGELLYGLKYSRGEGLSVAEALEISIEKAGTNIASALTELAEAGGRIAKAESDIADQTGDVATYVEELALAVRSKTER